MPEDEKVEGGPAEGPNAGADGTVETKYFADRAIMATLGKGSVLSRRVTRLMDAARSAEEATGGAAGFVVAAVDGTFNAILNLGSRLRDRMDLIETALRTIEGLGIAPVAVQKIAAAVRAKVLTDEELEPPQKPLQ